MVTAKVQQLVRAANRARDLRWRQPPPLRFDPAHPGPRTVYYLSPDLVTPSGGVRNIYRHVDALNAAGIAAAVLHTAARFRCRWFANGTRTVAARDVTLGAGDLLVVPECYSPGLARLPAGARKVIFNQGAYHTFDHIGFDDTAAGAPYAAVPNLAALLTVSEDSQALLGHAFPGLEVHRARLVVDGDVFHPGPYPRPRRIGYLLNRRPAEREQLLHILRSRGLLADWQLVAIHGRTEAETAELMRGCALFFSFSDRDGFGLPPAEAMASGCHVVGYTGLGGREFFDPDHCSPVPENDLLAFARAAEAAMADHDDDPEATSKKGRLAAERVLGRYTHDGLRADLLAFYGPLLGR